MNGGNGLRAGAYALSLLAEPLNVHALQALGEGPMSLTELCRVVGSPPQSTMRDRLRNFSEIGVIERQPHNGLPRSLSYVLAPPGRDLLLVAGVLEDWLAASPEGQIELGSIAAKSAIKALVGGWSSAIVRALAARPLSLTELSRLISTLNYPSLERRLGALRLTGQVEARPNQARLTPYAISGWLRRAVAPMAAGMRWERKHLPADTAPLSRIDVEAAFLLSVPLLELPSDFSGICRLAVEFRRQTDNQRLAGAVVEVQDGTVCSCTSRLEGHADAWAAGTPGNWITALIDRQVDALELGGASALATGLLEGLHSVLFSAARAKLPAGIKASTAQ
jgi:DNA-binding HxlR family transcriptional regulator